ncbi:ABC transporter substrate-binding protein [Bradyrhizobium sp. SSBR45G]|uniref:substrate-binding periplasmic protein n=1 Tax=unclassified Bradyrhizobium TaxID=2631580 RepID=UPI002342B99A|nr:MULTISPECIES: transporter substrate-binding domain-containing protein [unclassified Bradyrhizobium]GLH77289.1 ABC transporter substrate-binding protein [Bradyrhizobium sp. SSBR45G]GLH84047.1 ABC transporter substrate-binding protein [Bradyrhizobium sp. SSBR45R]
MRRVVCWAAAMFISTATTAASAADDVLRICLDENLPPLSIHHRGKPGMGFDVMLGQAIADRLGKKLEIQWYESKLDEDSSPALEANALLSDGRCALVASYAFTQDGLVAPGVKTAKLPDFDGATRDDRRRRVPLGTLTPSKPYLFSTLTVVLGPGAPQRPITDIGDLAGLRLAIESGTLADAILMTFDKGRLIDDITHLIPTRGDLLGALEQGKFDATLLDNRRFDAYRAAHPESRLRPSGYSYPIGVNRGYVGLSSSAELLASVDNVLTALNASGALASLARDAGLTYLPPREPVILGDAFQKVIRSGAR